MISEHPPRLVRKRDASQKAKDRPRQPGRAFLKKPRRHREGESEARGRFAGAPLEVCCYQAGHSQVAERLPGAKGEFAWYRAMHPRVTDPAASPDSGKADR